MSAVPFMPEADRRHAAAERGRALLDAMPEPRAPKPRPAIVGAEAFLAGFTPPEYLLEPIIVCGQLVALTAPPNVGKTAIALACALAACGLAEVPGLLGNGRRVLFLAGENEVNAAAQLLGAMRHYCVDPAALAGRVWVLPARAPLAELLGDIAAQATAVGGFDLIVVDTKIAFSASEDENDNASSAEDAALLRDLTRIAGSPAVLVLCHPAKGAVSLEQMIPRGGSAFFGELDANLALLRGDGSAELAHNKLRAPPFDSIRFDLRPIDLDMLDARGRPVRSVVAVAVPPGQAAVAEQVARSDEDMLLRAMLREPLGTFDAWSAACGFAHRSRVARTMKRLAEDRLARKFRGRWELTDRGRKEAENA